MAMPFSGFAAGRPTTAGMPHPNGHHRERSSVCHNKLPNPKRSSSRLLPKLWPQLVLTRRADGSSARQGLIVERAALRIGSRWLRLQLDEKAWRLMGQKSNLGRLRHRRGSGERHPEPPWRGQPEFRICRSHRRPGSYPNIGAQCPCRDAFLLREFRLRAGRRLPASRQPTFFNGASGPLGGTIHRDYLPSWWRCDSVPRVFRAAGWLSGVAIQRLPAAIRHTGW